MLSTLHGPARDVAGAFGANPLIERVVLGPGREGASMQASVQVSTGSGFLPEATVVALDRVPADASVTDLLAARRTALTV